MFKIDVLAGMPRWPRTTPYIELKIEQSGHLQNILMEPTPKLALASTSHLCWRRPIFPVPVPPSTKINPSCPCSIHPPGLADLAMLSGFVRRVCSPRLLAADHRHAFANALHRWSGHTSEGEQGAQRLNAAMLETPAGGDNEQPEN